MAATKQDTKAEPDDTKAEPDTLDDVIDGEAEEIVEATPEEAERLVEAEQTQALVLHERENSPAPVAVLPSAQEWEATMMMARTIAATPFVPVAYRGQPEAVVAAILYGREIGVGPMQALQKIHMIDGKPSLSADLIMAQMRKGGIVVVASESTAARAWIHARRSDTGEEAEVEWTIEEARGITTREKGQTITLDQKATWRSYPADMLWARCVGRLARRLGSDLLGGVLPYSSEEVQDWDDGGYVGSGYDTPATAPAVAAAAPATSKGVELRADAPRGWQEIVAVLTQIDPAMPWQPWVLEAASAACGVNVKTLREVPEESYKDTVILVANGAANLAEARAGAEFPPPTREEVQAAFGAANSVGVKLTGPDTPLDPTEAAGAAESAEEAETAENPDETPDEPEAPADEPTEGEAP